MFEVSLANVECIQRPVLLQLFIPFRKDTRGLVSVGMSQEQHLDVKNVKISFRQNLDKHFSRLRRKAINITDSYIILKHKYTFTIYHKAKDEDNKHLVNITGIPNFEHIKHAYRHFMKWMRIPDKSARYVQVDNTTASGQLSYPINFSLLIKCGLQVSHTPLFPGASVILPNNITTIVFKSGKYIIVGCKNKSQLAESFEKLKAITESLQTIL